MEGKLIRKHLKIIKKILWEDWDPMGINFIDDIKDEYAGYAPEIYKIINNKGDAEVVAEYLSYVTKEFVFELPDHVRDLTVANKLIKELNNYKPQHFSDDK